MDHLHLIQSIDTDTGGGLTSSCTELVMAQRSISTDASYYSTTARSENIDGVFQRSIENPFLFAYGFKFAVVNHPAEVIHSHGLYMYSSYLANQHKKKFGSEMVVHIHGMFEPWILGRSRIKKGLVNLLFENYKYKKAEYWRALTSKEADQIRAFGIRGKIFILPNGINLEPIDEYLKGKTVQKNSKSILFLGRLHPKKGIAELLEVWLALPKSSKMGWTLDIVGPDEGILRRLSELALNADDVKFKSSVYGEEKYEILNSADYFILPSYSEGFSMAVLEAMAFSKPVIITDACNFEESYNYGALKLPNDQKEWSKELERILQIDDSEKIQRGQSLRKLVENKYQWKKIASEMQEILSK